MKFLVLLSLVLFAANAQAVKLNCANIIIDLDETSLKTTLTYDQGNSVVVTYASLLRQLRDRTRQVYDDSYFFPVTNETILHFRNSVYVYSKKNKAGEVVVPDTRCQKFNP